MRFFNSGLGAKKMLLLENTFSNSYCFSALRREIKNWKTSNENQFTEKFFSAVFMGSEEKSLKLPHFSYNIYLFKIMKVSLKVKSKFFLNVNSIMEILHSALSQEICFDVFSQGCITWRFMEPQMYAW